MSQNTIQNQNSENDALLKSTYRKPCNLEKRAKEEQEQLISDQQQVAEHGKNLSALLSEYTNNYSKRNSTNRCFRLIFFGVSISILIGLTIVAPDSILFLLCKGKISNFAAISGFFTSMVSMLASIIVLPKIIAEYLFSTNEDVTNAEIVKEIIKSDLEIRNKVDSESIDDQLDGGLY